MIKDLERYVEVESIVYDDRRCCRRSCFDFKRSIPYYYKG